jgi:hypothetical protein
MKAATLLRLLACVSFLVAAWLLLIAYDEGNRVGLIWVALSGFVGVNFLMRATNSGERRLW